MPANKFLDYPMGPSLRTFLGIAANDYAGGSETNPPDANRDQDFTQLLESRFLAAPISDRAILIDLLEELTAMGLSRLAVRLRELNPDIAIADDFRALLALGSATMMEGEFEDAEHLLLMAHFVAPEESAPFLNLAEIYYATERDHDALNWSMAGLKIMPNRSRLWELVASIYLHSGEPNAAAKVRALALTLESYAGLSLAADMTDARDPLLKAQFLESLYDQGVRDEDFLVEYTAVLGLARQYEKVPPIVWQAEKSATKQISWQLYAHAAQAHLGMQQESRAEEILVRLERYKGCPPEVVTELRSTYETSGSDA